MKNLEMLLRSAELTHASEKFDFTAKEFGARSFVGCAVVANQLAAA